MLTNYFTLVTLIVAPDLHDAGGGNMVKQGFI